MDSFFVSIEERDAPELKGKPVAVGGQATQRGVISTSNYIAREFGVFSAMATQHALRLCPDLIILPVNMDKYREASQKIRNIFHDFSPLVEPLSLDEAFLDVTGIARCHGSATWMAQEIRRKIYETVSLTASAGISVNKFIAKVASDWKKPNGQFVVPPEDVDKFVSKLPIEKIYGVGPKTAEKLHQFGIRTCHDLRRYSEVELVNTFRSLGTRLFHLCRGVDTREVEPNRIRKSVSVETTFANDICELRKIVDAINALIEKLNNRLSKLENKRYNKVFLKLKFYDFQIATIEKSASTLILEDLVQMLQERLHEEEGNWAIRLLGIGVRLCVPKKDEQQPQIDLFSS